MVWVYLAVVTVGAAFALWAIWLFLTWLDEKFEELGDSDDRR